MISLFINADGDPGNSECVMLSTDQYELTGNSAYDEFITFKTSFPMTVYHTLKSISLNVLN